MGIRLFCALRARAVFAFFGLFTAVSAAFAENFRIETKVFVGVEKPKQQPVSETTTLFLDGIVYDFLKKPEQTAVFRKPRGGTSGEFTLLNDQHTIKTRFSTHQVAGFTSKVRSWAAGQRDPFLQFAANPQFEETFDGDNGKLILASHLENYTVSTMPADHPEAAAEYKEFLDWYAQLNPLLSASRLPAEPRLRLNSVLARRKVIPLKVELARAGEDPLRAEHTFTWRLSQDDYRRIDDVRAALASYKEVSNEQFLQETRPRQPAK